LQAKSPRAALPQTGLETAIVRGGFPELHANPDIDHVAFYNSYLATYLERDVRSLAICGISSASCALAPYVPQIC
jgi:hypothetical protein